MTRSFSGLSARNFADERHGSSRNFSASFRGVSPRNLAEKKKKSARTYAKSRGVFSAKVRLSEVCSRSEREKRAFFLGSSVFVKMNNLIQNNPD